MKAHRIVTLLAALSGTVVLGQEIEVRELGNSRLEFTLIADEILDEAAAQRLLRPRVEEECGDVEASFGRYRFESLEPLRPDDDSERSSSYRFIQEITCGAAESRLTIDREMGIERKDPAQQLEAFIRAVSIRFLEDRSSGAFEDACAALSTQMRSFATREAWSARAQEFNESSGAMEAATVWRVTVYDNPQGAPTPGTYIAADYEIEYESIALQCGYLMWFELPKQRYVVLREESGILPAEIVERIPEDQLPEVKIQLGCAR
ncbi:MAG TPA: DUF4019 domain-containing protein [Gammaproteobacteria bacterium]|nr:DUF4019 domain-containing protein [Gammaproteobacteria bacterium]